MRMYSSCSFTDLVKISNLIVANAFWLRKLSESFVEINL